LAPTLNVRRVPHISLVFREMWDSTALAPSSHTKADLFLLSKRLARSKWKVEGTRFLALAPDPSPVPHTPDFLWSFVGSLNFMRLSLKKRAHTVLSRAAYRKFGASRSFFARCGIPQRSPRTPTTTRTCSLGDLSHPLISATTYTSEGCRETELTPP
jgi:hypothetical protein